MITFRHIHHCKWSDRGSDILDNCLANVQLNSSMLKFDEAKACVRELDWKMSWPPPVFKCDSSDPRLFLLLHQLFPLIQIFIHHNMRYLPRIHVKMWMRVSDSHVRLHNFWLIKNSCKTCRISTLLCTKTWEFFYTSLCNTLLHVLCFWWTYPQHWLGTCSPMLFEIQNFF